MIGISCKRCGCRGHILKDCKSQVRCVNCNQVHMSNSAACPLELAGRERRAALLERRVVLQVRAVQPDASLAISEPKAQPPTPAPSRARGGPPPYADVLLNSWKLVFTDEASKTAVVSLPETKPLASLAVAHQEKIPPKSEDRPRPPAKAKRSVTRKSPGRHRLSAPPTGKVLRCVNLKELQRMISLIRSMSRLGALIPTTSSL